MGCIKSSISFRMSQPNLILWIFVMLSPFGSVVADESCEVVDKNCTTAINDQCPNNDTYYHIFYRDYNTPCCCNCPDGTISLGPDERTCHPSSHYITPEPQHVSDKPEFTDSATLNNKSPMPMLSPTTSGSAVLKVFPTKPDENSSSRHVTSRKQKDKIPTPPDEAYEQEQTGIPTTTSKINTDCRLWIGIALTVVAVVIIVILVIAYRWQKNKNQDVQRNDQQTELHPLADTKADNKRAADDDNTGQQNDGVMEDELQPLADTQADNEQAADDDNTSHKITPEPQHGSDKPEFTDSATLNNKSPMPTPSLTTSGSAVSKV